MKYHNLFRKFIITTLMIFVLFLSHESTAAMPMRLVVNGRDITTKAAPVLENNRTMVPLRFIAEELGAVVKWDEVNRVVTATRDGKTITLAIGSKVILSENNRKSVTSDVAPFIIEGRTYVPLRVISNAFEIGIDWNNMSRTAYVDSSRKSAMEPFYSLKILSPLASSKITGTTSISIGIDSKDVAKGSQLRALILDSYTRKGFVVALAPANSKQIVYTPKPEDNGEKILAVALYDSNGNLISADSVPVIVEVQPQVALRGITDGMTITGALNITPEFNFSPFKVTYSVKNNVTGTIKLYEDLDPYGAFTWNPTFEQRGDYTISVKAYDSRNNSFDSRGYQVKAMPNRSISLSGVSQGAKVNSPVNLIANRNFDVRDTSYILKDKATGVETILATMPYGGYTWFPVPAHSGSKELIVRVTDTTGQQWSSAPVSVQVDGSPKLQIQGLGPGAVITEAVKVDYRSNVEITNIKYVFTNVKSGDRRASAAGSKEVSFVPLSGDDGDWRVQAEGNASGTIIKSDTVQFKVFTGKTFGPYSIIAKDQFLNYASAMAVDSMKKTGMSAAIQTAQAILETGWGQSVPSDKYSNKKSNNLFGIKGEGSNGSVISNTWEVYNGVTYRVDAKFRAYKNASESWNDHKALLLKADRYQIFRDVMNDYIAASWAVRRAGYATDPLYSMKLINLVRQYDLQKLDLLTF